MLCLANVCHLKMSPGEGRGSSVPQSHGSPQKGTDSDRLGSAQEKIKYFVYLRNGDKMIDRQSLEGKKSGLACPTAHRTCSHWFSLLSCLDRDLDPVQNSAGQSKHFPVDLWSYQAKLKSLSLVSVAWLGKSMGQESPRPTQV